jgi:hypothetical protein
MSTSSSILALLTGIAILEIYVLLGILAHIFGLRRARCFALLGFEKLFQTLIGSAERAIAIACGESMSVPESSLEKMRL